MRNSLLATLLLGSASALTMLAVQACSGGSDSSSPPGSDGGGQDSAVHADASIDTGKPAAEGGSDASLADASDTGLADTGLADTGHADTGTGPADATPADTGAAGDSGDSGDGASDAGIADAPVDSPPLCNQTPYDGGSVPILVAKGQNQPIGIAVDDTHVYWGNVGDGTIVRCPLAGCGANPPEVFAASGGTPEQIVVQGGTVYWINFFGSLNRCPTSGCGDAGPYSFPATSGAGFTLDQTTIYWTEFTPGILASCPLSGCTQPTVLYQGAKGLAYGLAVGSGEVYFVNDLTGQVLAAPITGVPDGGSPRLVVADSDPTYVALSGTNLFYDSLGNGQVKVLPSSSNDAAVPAPIATTDQHAAGITVDVPCGTVYWEAYGPQGVDGGATGGGVYRCPVGGCSDAGPEVVARAPVTPEWWAAVDQGFVYWTDKYAGNVWKQAK